MCLETEETMNTFETAMRNLTVTENGALAHRTTFEPLLDCNYGVSAARLCTYDLLENWKEAFNRDAITAMCWLFYLRDCRGGLGERHSFRDLFTEFAKANPELASPFIPLVPVYGRWDDLVYTFMKCEQEHMKTEISRYLKNQLVHDLSVACLPNGEELTDSDVSLCAKWMPSENASSAETKAAAQTLRKAFKWTPREYRQTLSSLRKYLNVVECNMSSKNYSKINYEEVPAKAGMYYSAAFSRNDSERYTEYIQKCLNGDGKINVSGINPYEVLRRAVSDPSNALYNVMWNFLLEKGFPDSDRFGKALCVVDTSGSMEIQLPNTNICYMDIAISLGLYFSSKMEGEFKDKMITFSANPSWIDVSHCSTLSEKYAHIKDSEWGMNTNIDRVFNLILTAARNAAVKSDDMPDTLLIVSDMQFDDCVTGMYDNETIKTVFDHISDKWHDYGYKLPKLVFWNVGGSGDTIPMIDCGDNGVALISGFNQNAAKVADSDAKDPLVALLEVLNSDRYKAVVDVCKNI